MLEENFIIILILDMRKIQNKNIKPFVWDHTGAGIQPHQSGLWGLGTYSLHLNGWYCLCVIFFHLLLLLLLVFSRMKYLPYLQNVFLEVHLFIPFFVPFLPLFALAVVDNYHYSHLLFYHTIFLMLTIISTLYNCYNAVSMSFHCLFLMTTCTSLRASF